MSCEKRGTKRRGLWLEKTLPRKKLSVPISGGGGGGGWEIGPTPSLLGRKWEGGENNITGKMNTGWRVVKKAQLLSSK